MYICIDVKLIKCTLSHIFITLKSYLKCQICSWIKWSCNAELRPFFPYFSNHFFFFFFSNDMLFLSITEWKVLHRDERTSRIYYSCTYMLYIYVLALLQSAPHHFILQMLCRHYGDLNLFIRHTVKSYFRSDVVVFFF